MVGFYKEFEWNGKGMSFKASDKYCLKSILRYGKKSVISLVKNFTIIFNMTMMKRIKDILVLKQALSMVK